MKNCFLSFLVIIPLALVLCINVSIAGEIHQDVFTINNSTVGVTTLDEVQKMYGEAEMYRVSREDEANIAVCYSHSSNKEKYFLVFESSVMGSNKQITGLRLSYLLPSTNCMPTTADLSSSTTGNGVRLGQSQKDFLKAFPVKFKRRNTELFYEAVSQRNATETELKRLRATWPDEKQDYFDVTITIKANIKKNRLVDFHIQKIESY